MSTFRLRLDFEKILWGIALLGIALFFVVRARKPAEVLAPLTPAVRASMVSANNDFGFRLFNVLAPRQLPNLMLSPADLQVGLGLLANGAHGATRAQIASLLEWTGPLAPAQEDGVLVHTDQALQVLAGELFAADAHVQVTAANALWVEKSLALSTRFRRLNSQYFDTSLHQVHFSERATASAMNKWVSHQTHGTIPVVDGAGTFDARTRMIALNALTVKNTWMEKFDPTLTREEAFTLLDGTAQMVPMMHRDGALLYAEDSLMQVVKLPCGEGKVSMVLLLPRAGQRLDAVCQAVFNAAQWPALQARLRSREGRLALPRCRITSSINCADVLPALGLVKAFAPGQADFTAMSAMPCSLNALQHTIALDINEGGDRPVTPTPHTLAEPGDPSDPPFALLANRPFLFALLADDGAVLLLGSVTAPCAEF